MDAPSLAPVGSAPNLGELGKTNDSTFSTALRCESGMTWVYTLSVVSKSECPSWACITYCPISSRDTAKGNLSFMFKGDFFHDAVANELDGVVREAYLDTSRAWLDVRLGRQVVTWGVGDLVFINDVFPKDWGAFFSGRPLEYLKVGVDAAKLHLATPALNAELVVIPFFEPDTLPGPERFFFFDPLAAVGTRFLREPATTAGNTEFALRLYRRVAGSDVSLYAYRGYWRQPAFRPDQLPAPTQLQGFYPRLAAYGASAQRNIGAALPNHRRQYL